MPIQPAKLHERLDLLTDQVQVLAARIPDQEEHGKLLEKLNEIGANVAKQQATCEPCRKIVLGNGRRPMDARVTTLESSLASSTKCLWALIGAVTAAAGWMLPHLFSRP